MNTLAPALRPVNRSRNALSVRQGFDALQVIRQGLADNSQERLITVNLDENHKVIGFEVVRVGPRTMEARIVEVFSSTLHFDASAVIVVHVVPGGNGDLDERDRDLAERLRAAAEMMGVEMVDYVAANA